MSDVENVMPFEEEISVTDDEQQEIEFNSTSIELE